MVAGGKVAGEAAGGFLKKMVGKLLRPAEKIAGKGSVDLTKKAGVDLTKKAGVDLTKKTGKDARREAEEKLAKEMAEDANKKVDNDITDALDKSNPKFDANKSAYSENCTGVTQAYELRRRGMDVEAGPLEKHLRTDEGGPGGRNLSAIEGPWGRQFTSGARSDIDDAFKEPGSRGIVYVAWHGGGAHVFNVENVGGKVRYIDAQPTPIVQDASHYFSHGGNTHYVRLDDLPTPSSSKVKPYLEP